MKQIKLTVPNNWNDITIQQYQKFMILMDSKKSERAKTMDLISLFCKVPLKQLKQFAIGDLEKIGAILIKMTKEEPTDVKLTKHVDFKNDVYSVLPNMSKMTTGEFVDLETYCEDAIKNLHKIMSILYRKQTDKVDRWGRYSVEEYDPTEEKERKMLGFPMGYALGILNFFFHLEKKLLTDSRNCLVKLT
tara:strand:- start:19812 stop:20381 length:570 start_codon:yes stop_codon:yes gene_type:complete